jgi:hypothetical protein
VRLACALLALPVVLLKSASPVLQGACTGSRL